MTGLFIFLIFGLCCVLIGAYSLLAPWWRRRSSTAYFGLVVALLILSGFFLAEELVGQWPDWVQDVVLGILVLALVWNVYTIVWKQIHYWHKTHPDPAQIVIEKEP
jgi:cytochrome b